jgi:hypothetical protein
LSFVVISRSPVARMSTGASAVEEPVYGVLDDNTGKVGKERYTLDADSIKSGLQLMQQEYPRHFAAFVSEDDDAETADVFLQCCLLGMVKYG